MLLEELSEANGVSGSEGPVRDVLRRALEHHVDGLRADTMGNLIAVKQARGGDKPIRVLVCAHMDEIGLMITRVASNGMLHFGKVGGIDDRVLLSKVVHIGANRVPGVIGCKPIHLQKRGERDQVVSSEDMRIDIGAGDKAAAERLVKVGDYATFATRFADLGPSWKGKALDDRVGCSVLVDILKEEYPVTLVGGFTVQEEVGLRGARVVSYATEPDYIFVLEGTLCDDGPKESDVTPCTCMGDGPAITFMDRGLIASRPLVDLLVHTAEENNIPYQFKQAIVGGTDAGPAHLARSGVPSAVVSVSTRYSHSPASIVLKSDYEYTVALMRETLRRLPTVAKEWETR